MSDEIFTPHSSLVIFNPRPVHALFLILEKRRS
jgi:hypothetical protein